MKRISPAFVTSVLVIALTMWLPQPTARAAEDGAAPPPAADPKAEAEKAAAEKAAEVFQTLFGDELKRVQATPLTADDVALAAKLLDAAKSATNQPALLAILCEKAVQLGAADPKGYDTALAAAALLAANVPAKAEACQEMVLVVRQRQYEQARGDDKARLAEPFIDQLLAVAAIKAGVGDMEDALKRCRQASAVAHASSADSVERIAALIKKYADLQKALAQAPRLKTALAANPADRASREQLIRLYLVELDNPAEAAKYLDDSCDAALRKYVPAAAKEVAAAPEVAAMELADWYSALSGTAQTTAGKVATLVRASAYYQHFLDVHADNDLDRTKAELALKKADAEIAKLGGAAASSPAAKSLDLLKLVDLARDAPDGYTVKAPAGLVMATDRQHTPKLCLPVIPNGDYEIEIQFTRTAGDEAVCLVLPVGKTNVAVAMGVYKDTVSGLSTINGKDVAVNETTVKSGLLTGHAYTLLVRVTTSSDKAGDKADIVATLDGKPFVKWSGLQAALATSATWRPINPQCPMFANFQADTTLRSARLKMLSGKAVTLAEAAKAPKGT